MRLASVIVLFLMLARPLSAETPITLRVYPLVSFAPASIRLTILVPHHPDNRSVCVSLEGDSGFSRSSCYTHEAGGRVMTLINYPDLPAGAYSAVAEVFRAKDGKSTSHRSVVVNFRVIGFEG